MDYFFPSFEVYPELFNLCFFYHRKGIPASVPAGFFAPI